MSALTTYEKPSEALATITDDTKFRLFRRTHGRPEEIPPSDGNGWTKEAFKQAILDQTIPKVPLLIRPLSSRGTLSNKRVSLDLSFSDESTTLETADDGKAMSSAPVGSAIQETVLAALLQSYTDERELVWELREKIDELQEEVAALKTENQKLKSDIEHSSSNDPLSKTIEKALVSVCGGPGGYAASPKASWFGSCWSLGEWFDLLAKPAEILPKFLSSLLDGKNSQEVKNQ